MRPKMKNGTWIEPFDEFAIEGSGDWAWSGGPGYVEGNAWNYTWFVPHDVEGLINLFGGEEPFCKKLYESFSNGQFTINNEPDISYPYLFRYIKGEEYKTDELVQKIMNESFGTDQNGLPGNDDCGTISAWFIFSSLGIYPVLPASNRFILGYPLFNKAEIRPYPALTGNEQKITIIKSYYNNGKNNRIKLNNTEINNFVVSQSELSNNSKLIFYVR